MLTPDRRFARALTHHGPDGVTFLPVPDAAAAARLLAGTTVAAAVLDSIAPPVAAAEFLRWWRAAPDRAAQPLILAAAGRAAPLPPGARRSRRSAAAIARAITEAAPLVLDELRRELRANRARISLTPSEAALLGHLVRAGGLVPTAELARQALGYEDRAGGPVVRTHLSNLRRKCAAAGLPEPIVARRGRGYQVVGVRLPD